MNNLPPQWSDEELSQNVLISADNFRAERLAASDAWAAHYKDAHAKFDLLFEKLGDSLILDGHKNLANIYQSEFVNRRSSVQVRSSAPLFISPLL